jgi:hypothetical protein
MIPQRNLPLLSNRLYKEHGGRRIPEAVLDRDYCLAWFLIGLSQSKLKDLLIFKGGTALKRCHFGEYRFSEDLDFTLQRKAEFAEIREGLEEVYELVAQASGIRFAFEGEDRQAHVNSYTFYLRCQGPLPTTRSRVSFFMNRFRELGFIEYNGRIKVHKSPLNAVLLDRLPEVGPERPVSSTTARTRSKPTRRL